VPIPATLIVRRRSDSRCSALRQERPDRPGERVARFVGLLPRRHAQTGPREGSDERNPCPVVASCDRARWRPSRHDSADTGLATQVGDRMSRQYLQVHCRPSTCAGCSCRFSVRRSWAQDSARPMPHRRLEPSKRRSSRRGKRPGSSEHHDCVERETALERRCVPHGHEKQLLIAIVQNCSFRYA
jgi:hypothetical protein